MSVSPYQPNSRWLVSGEVQFVGWSAYDELNISFTQEVLGGYDIDATKNYKNTRIYCLGGQFNATNRFDFRLGAYFDESPVRENYLNPETPSMNKLGLTHRFYLPSGTKFWYRLCVLVCDRFRA